MKLPQLQLEIQYQIQNFDIRYYRITPLIFSNITKAILLQIGADIIKPKRGIVFTQNHSVFDIRRMIEDYYVAYDIQLGEKVNE